MKSSILLQVTRENEIQGKKVIIREYITDLYTYTKLPKLNLLFRKDTNKTYRVYEEEQKLVEFLPGEQQVKQINQLKSMIATIDIKEDNFGEKRKYTIEGKGDSVTLNGEIITAKVKGLEKTVNQLVYKNAQEASLFEISLEADELVENSLVAINIQGNNVQTKMVITDINVDNPNTNEFDHIYNYQID